MLVWLLPFWRHNGADELWRAEVMSCTEPRDDALGFPAFESRALEATYCAAAADILGGIAVNG